LIDYGYTMNVAHSLEVERNK